MKQLIYDPKAPKKRTNLSINSDLLQQAKRLEINLSQTMEKTLEELLLEEKRRAWKKDNRYAIKSYNNRVEKHGVFSDGLRRF